VLNWCPTIAVRVWSTDYEGLVLEQALREVNTCSVLPAYGYHASWSRPERNLERVDPRMTAHYVISRGRRETGSNDQWTGCHAAQVPAGDSHLHSVNAGLGMSVSR